MKVLIFQIVYFAFLYTFFKFKLFKKMSKLSFNQLNIHYTSYLLIILSLFLIVFTISNGIVGFKWDEHYIALGGYYIYNGLIPHVDFIIPNGAFIYYLQAIGHFFTNDIALAYTIPATIINVIVFLLIFKLTKVDKTLLSTLFYFILFIFTFFAPAGSLWYNQLSALLITLAIVLIFNLQIDTKKTNYFISTSIVSLLVFLSIITKLDSAFLGLFLILSLLIIDKKFKYTIKIILEVLGYLVLYFLIFYFIFNINILDSLNYGQEGYAKRITFDIVFIKKIIHSLLGQSTLIIKSILFIQILLFIYYKNNKSNLFMFSQLFIFLIATLVDVTSGKGAGFVNSHFTIMSLITFMYYLYISKIFFQAIYILLLPIVVTNIFYFYKSFIPSFPLVKDETMNYYSSSETIEVLSKIRELSNTFEEPIKLYSNLKYFSMNSNISSEIQIPQLWNHLGVVTNNNKQQENFNIFITNPYDIVVVNYFNGNYNYNSLDNFGIYKKDIEQFINQNYTKFYEGKIDIIGTGGGNPYHNISIFRINKKEQN